MKTTIELQQKLDFVTARGERNPDDLSSVRDVGVAVSAQRRRVVHLPYKAFFSFRYQLMLPAMFAKTS
ncbi:hypothetical protein G3O06_13845 [Burkholderia sp. Ac-20345]|uniref:hypothetical protein n=1 Tax=Burkholderia sp. Ac-20345 TaxID=2703891 RepID=UPI00197BFF5E|nr:hypothetical protein [Burkholderia sp. Ac-20345]MBN3778628.1 hypothetical protein [Burkholderia sp. Ac-20345]